MGPKLPRVTGPQVVRALQGCGWYPDRQRGSHVQMRNPDRPGMRVTVPVHAGETLKLSTLKTILDQAGLSTAEFVKLL